MWPFVRTPMGNLSENCPDKRDRKINATAVNSIYQSGIQADERGLQMTDDAEVWKIGSLPLMLVAL